VLYLILGTDAPGSLEIRKRVRPRHLERIAELVDVGRIAIAGPCPVADSPEPGPQGFSGSVIIAEFESLEAARAWVAGDPYVSEGVFEACDVRPFIKVLP
jgi:uncharacterized protein YciI